MLQGGVQLCPVFKRWHGGNLNKKWRRGGTWPSPAVSSFSTKYPVHPALPKLYKQHFECLKYPAGQVQTSLSNFVFRQCFLSCFDQERADVSLLVHVFVRTPRCTRTLCPCTAGAGGFRGGCCSSLFFLIIVFCREPKLECREVRLNKVLTRYRSLICL